MRGNEREDEREGEENKRSGRGCAATGTKQHKTPAMVKAKGKVFFSLTVTSTKIGSSTM